MIGLWYRFCFQIAPARVLRPMLGRIPATGCQVQPAHKRHLVIHHDNFLVMTRAGWMLIVKEKVQSPVAVPFLLVKRHPLRAGAKIMVKSQSSTWIWSLLLRWTIQLRKALKFTGSPSGLPSRTRSMRLSISQAMINTERCACFTVSRKARKNSAPSTRNAARSACSIANS